MQLSELVNLLKASFDLVTLNKQTTNGGKPHRYWTKLKGIAHVVSPKWYDRKIVLRTWGECHFTQNVISR